MWELKFFSGMTQARICLECKVVSTTLICSYYTFMGNSQHHYGSLSSNYFRLTASGILLILMRFLGEF